MVIKKITLDGFCNIEKSTIEFDKIDAIVALNNYGKSNFLKGIDFAKDFIIDPPKEKNGMMRYQPLIPINKALESKNFFFELEFEIIFKKVKTLISYSFGFEWIKDDGKKGAKIVSEQLKFMPVKKDARFKTIVKRSVTSAYFQSSISGRCDNKIPVKKNELIVNKLYSYDNLFYNKIITAINDLNIVSVDSLGHPDQLFRTISVDFTPNRCLEMPISSNAAYFLYNLKEEKKDQYKILKSSILSLLPNIEDFAPIELDFKDEIDFSGDKDNIPYKLPEKIYDIRVKEFSNNQQTSISTISSGSKKIFYILTMVIAGELNNIPLLIFEEIENSIHPTLLQRLLIIIDTFCNRTKILTTSHSPYLIKYLDIENIYLGVPNSGNIAIFKKIKKSKHKKLMGYAIDEENNLGDFIFDKLVESNTDNNFFEEFVF